MRLHEVIVEDNVNEATTGLDSIGMPSELSIKLLQDFDFSHDKTPIKLDSAPSTNAAKQGYLIIRKAGNNWYTVTNIGKQWHLYAYVDGKIKEDFGYKFSEVKPNFGSGRSEWWRIPVGMRRDEKPANDVDSVRQRKNATGKMGAGEGILTYANRVFLPGLKEKIGPMIDEIYSSIRSLPRDKSQYGRNIGYHDKSARQAALKYADTMEEILENGFTRDTIKTFLDSMGRLSQGWGSIPANEKALKYTLEEPNARAKFAKTLIDIAKKQYDRFQEMKSRVEQSQQDEE